MLQWTAILASLVLLLTWVVLGATERKVVLLRERTAQSLADFASGTLEHAEVFDQVIELRGGYKTLAVWVLRLPSVLARVYFLSGAAAGILMISRGGTIQEKGAGGLVLMLGGMAAVVVSMLAARSRKELSVTKRSLEDLIARLSTDPGLGQAGSG